MAIFTLKNTLFLIRSNQRCGRETRRGRIELIKIFGGRLRSPALVVPWRADGPLTGDHLVRVWESLALINLTARYCFLNSSTARPCVLIFSLSLVFNMFSKALLVASFLLLSPVAAVPCIGFDINWGLYVFGLAQDYSLGPSSNWNQNPLQGGVLTTTGRPPFNGPNTSCYLSQYSNALYVLNADTTQPSNMHIYSFETQSWTTQQLDGAGTDPNSLTAILDRNTNVFFALSNSKLYSLDMGTLAQSDGTTRPWVAVQDPPFAANNAYPKPVMALAENHIHFLNTGTPAKVNIFVIHFSYTQPEPQFFGPLEVGGSGFPSTTGQTASIFKDITTPQQKFAFVPDDGTNTYIFDVLANTTQAIAGPTVKSTSRLAASQRELVQMTSSGELWWIPLNPDDAQPNYSATWSKINFAVNTPTANPSGSGNGNTNGSASSSQTSTRTGVANSPSSNSSVPNSASHAHGSLGLLSTGLLTLGLGFCGLWSIL